MTTHRHQALLYSLRDMHRSIEHNVAQQLADEEKVTESLRWELVTARESLNLGDERLAALVERLKASEESNAALVDRIGRAEQAYTQLERSSNAKLEEQINKVHEELTAKLSAERNELETTQKLLAQARAERDEARTQCQAQEGAIAELHHRIVELKAIAPALDILADMIKELQGKLDESERRRMATEDDFGKLVGEHEDHVRKHEVLRNLLMGNDPTPDCDRYMAFAIAMGTDRHTAKKTVHEFVRNHPLCQDLQRQIDVLVKRTENEEPRLTRAEMLHQFKDEAFKLLECIINLTSKDVSALQYGPHHGHQLLHKHITAFARKYGSSFSKGDVLRNRD